METIIRSSVELMNDPEWVKSFEETRKKSEKEDIEENKLQYLERRKEVLYKYQTMRSRELTERKKRKILFDKMYKTPFTEEFKRKLDCGV